jgi:hypothetical protein
VILPAQAVLYIPGRSLARRGRRHPTETPVLPLLNRVTDRNGLGALRSWLWDWPAGQPGFMRAAGHGPYQDQVTRSSPQQVVTSAGLGVLLSLAVLPA